VAKPAAAGSSRWNRFAPADTLFPPRGTPMEPFLPFIDTFGQYRTATGREGEESRRPGHRRVAEGGVDRPTRPGRLGPLRELENGPKLEASGQFRVEKHAGKWWFVDPRASCSGAGVGASDVRRDTDREREEWFNHFPGATPEFAEFLVPSTCALKGHYAGVRRDVSRLPAPIFAGSGPDWRGDYAGWCTGGCAAGA
jgi:hypothetical protein